uniref:LAGLIDADG homing endonuclease n=1 Tax=Knipowitschia caucasica TaxID=637954 RepID=A0AAV2KAW2_KNICA
MARRVRYPGCTTSTDFLVSSQQSNTKQSLQKTLCLCLRGLPVVLGDDPSAFFKTCSDATDKDLYSETSVGILCIDEHPQLNPSRVSIVLEGSVVMEELANLPQAFCVLFGQIYALHLDYPKCMKSTFHFIQQVMLNLGRVELKPKIQSLKNQLSV